MTLTIQNFNKLEEALNQVYFDFGMWTPMETFAEQEAYIIGFYKDAKPEFPTIQVTLNRNRVDGHGYHLETKLWLASNDWVFLDEAFVSKEHLEDRYVLLKCVEEVIRGVEC